MKIKHELPFGVGKTAPYNTSFVADKLYLNFTLNPITYPLESLDIKSHNIIDELLFKNRDKVVYYDNPYHRMRKFLRRPYHPLQLCDVSNDSSSLHTGFAWFVYYIKQLHSFRVFIDPRAIHDKSITKILYSDNVTEKQLIEAVMMLFEKSPMIIFRMCEWNYNKVTRPFTDYPGEHEVPFLEEPLYGEDVLNDKAVMSHLRILNNGFEDTRKATTGDVDPDTLYLLFKNSRLGYYFLDTYYPDKHSEYVKSIYIDILGNNKEGVNNG